MKVSFPFSFKGESYLGKIYRPYIQLFMTSKRIDEWVPIEMLVDTGADYTLLPERLAEFLGINKEKDCQREQTYGVGGEEEIYLCKKEVIIKLGRLKKVIPVGFLRRDNVPALLGRMQALEILSLIMRNRTTIFEL